MGYEEMEYLDTNAGSYLWEDYSAREQSKEGWKDAKGKYNCSSSCLLDELVAVQNGEIRPDNDDNNLEFLRALPLRGMCNVKTVDDKAGILLLWYRKFKRRTKEALSQLIPWLIVDQAAEKKDCSMSTRTKIGLGFKEYFGKDEVFDLSTPSVMYPEPVEEVKPLYSGLVKAGEMHFAVPPWHLWNYCPPHTMDKVSDSETYASCDSSLKDKTTGFPCYLCLCKSRAASVPAGSRNSPASDTAGGSDPAASRNRPAVNSAVSAGWLNPAARPYFRPSSVYFHNMYWPNLSDPMYMNKGRWGTAVKTSAGYTRFKTDKPAGTQETNINAGTQDHDSDSEVDEQVIVVPSFPSNSFAGPSSSNGPSVMERNADYAEELAKLQRQEYEAKDAAARYGYLFSQETAKILSQAEAEIRNQGVSADRDPVGIDSAGGVSAGSTSAGSDPAGSNPAGSFQPAGSYEPAGTGNPAVSTSVSADFIPVHADESILPPGQSLSSSENTTRFPVCRDQLSSGIFTSSSYDDDFSATLTNLAPAVEVNPVTDSWRSCFSSSDKKQSSKIQVW
ncbi:hypothetical protein Tco_0997028 [Tanacetum coccineum]